MQSSSAQCAAKSVQRLMGRADQLAGVDPVRGRPAHTGPGLALPAGLVTGHGNTRRRCLRACVALGDAGEQALQESGATGGVGTAATSGVFFPTDCM